MGNHRMVPRVVRIPEKQYLGPRRCLQDLEPRRTVESRCRESASKTRMLDMDGRAASGQPCAVEDEGAFGDRTGAVLNINYAWWVSLFLTLTLQLTVRCTDPAGKIMLTHETTLSHQHADSPALHDGSSFFRYIPTTLGQIPHTHPSSL